MDAPVPDRLLPALLFALTAMTGFVDAVSYLALGHIFTANMTGNVVLLGFAMADTPGLSVARTGAALGAFVVGATIGGRVAAATAAQRLRSASIGAGIEAVLLLVATALATRAGEDLLRDRARLYALITLIGLAMGVRNAVVRKLAERDLTTTVVTMTIAGIAADSSLAGGKNPGWGRRVASVALLFAGAAAGAFLLRHSLSLPLAIAGLVAGLSAVAARVGAARAGPVSGIARPGRD